MAMVQVFSDSPGLSQWLYDFSLCLLTCVSDMLHVRFHNLIILDMEFSTVSQQAILTSLILLIHIVWAARTRSCKLPQNFQTGVQIDTPAYYNFAYPVSYGNARADPCYLENDEVRRPSSKLWNCRLAVHNCHEDSPTARIWQSVRPQARRYACHQRLDSPSTLTGPRYLSNDLI